jgi:hypothetical protein
MVKFDPQLLLAKLHPSGIVPTSGLFFFQEIAMLRAEARQRLEIRRQQSQFLRNEVNNNREIEGHISVITRSSIRVRDDYNKLLKTVDELTSEVSKLLFRHKFHTEVYHEITVFLYVTTCSLGNSYQHFGGTSSGYVDCAGISSCQQMLVLPYSVDLLTTKSTFLFGDIYQRIYENKITLQQLGLPTI